MDIGDPSEIPATRKKLPSMQELGAFDLEPCRVALAVPAAAASEVPAAVMTAAPSDVSMAPRTEPAIEIELAATAAAPNPRPPRPSPEQLRAALERADPATRKKLLRLIAGGRTVEQTAGQADDASGQPHRLAMSLNRSQAQAGSSPAPEKRVGQRPAQNSPRPSLVADGETLLKIDAHTDLLDAAEPPLSAEQRKATLQAQLAAARPHDPPRSENTAAHKVLFPAYDPREHGDDVRRPTRRSEPPIEGHFPAPRQPFQASYQHADGRPMNEAETKVEAVLQEQRCDQTLEVLARDGVNGLLLSPRDLDAAVENGVLDEPTATLLWKTWSALRPVIHVIDDEPSPPPTDAVDTAPAIAREEPNAHHPAPLECDDLPAEPLHPKSVLPEQGNAPAPASPEAGPMAIDRQPPSAAPEITEEVAITPPIRPDEAPAPPLERQAEGTARSASAGPAPSEARQQHNHGPRSASLKRYLVRGILALCVLYTSGQVGAWTWRQWGHWLVG